MKRIRKTIVAIAWMMACAQGVHGSESSQGASRDGNGLGVRVAGPGGVGSPNPVKTIADSVGASVSIQSAAGRLFRGEMRQDELALQADDGPKRIAEKIFLRHLQDCVSLQGTNFLLTRRTRGGMLLFKANALPRIEVRVQTQEPTEAGRLNGETTRTTVAFSLGFSVPRFCWMPMYREPVWSQWVDLKPEFSLLKAVPNTINEVGNFLMNGPTARDGLTFRVRLRANPRRSPAWEYEVDTTDFAFGNRASANEVLWATLVEMPEPLRSQTLTGLVREGNSAAKAIWGFQCLTGAGAGGGEGAREAGLEYLRQAVKAKELLAMYTYAQYLITNGVWREEFEVAQNVVLSMPNFSVTEMTPEDPLMKALDLASLHASKAVVRAKQASPAGSWVSEIRREGKVGKLYLEMEIDDRGHVSGKVHDEERGLAWITISEGTATGTNVSFKLTPNPGPAGFTGYVVFSPTRRELQGNWDEGDKRVALQWLPNTTPVVLQGMKFATEESRTNVYSRTLFSEAKYRGSLNRGGRISEIDVRLRQVGPGELAGFLDDRQAKIMEIPLSEGTFDAAKVTFKVPAWDAVCVLSRDPGDLLSGTWESRGRQVPFTLMKQQPTRFPDGSPAVDYAYREFTPFRQATAEQLALANAEAPAPSYVEATRTGNPYFLCDICSKGQPKKIMHPSGKGPCTGMPDALAPNADRTRRAALPTDRFVDMRGAVTQGAKVTQVALRLRIRGEDVQGEQIWTFQGRPMKLIIAGVVQDGVLKAKTFSAGEYWSDWEARFDANLETLKGTFTPVSKKANPAAGTFAFRRSGGTN